MRVQELCCNTDLPELPAVNVCSVEIGNVPEQEKWAKLLQNWNSNTNWSPTVVWRRNLASNSESDSCWEDISLKEGAAWPGRTCKVYKVGNVSNLLQFVTLLWQKWPSGYLQGSTPEGRGTTGGQNAEHFSQSSESIQIKLGYIFPKLGY